MGGRLGNALLTRAHLDASDQPRVRNLATYHTRRIRCLDRFGQFGGGGGGRRWGAAEAREYPPDVHKQADGGSRDAKLLVGLLFRLLGLRLGSSVAYAKFSGVESVRASQHTGRR